MVSARIAIRSQTLLSSCTHCGAQYQLDDKMLGKKARCKACAKLFVLTPAEPEVSLQDVEPPRRTGSTAQLRPVQQQEAWSDDPLDALASAAIESGSDMAPTRSSSYAAPAPSPRSRPHDDDEDSDRRRPKRMAKGAVGSMITGIFSGVCALLGIILGVVAMVIAYENQDAFVVTGLIAIFLLGVAAILGMIAVANANSATRAIRRARHPLDGKSQASIATIVGGIALVATLIMFVSGGVWLGKNPDATSFTQVVNAEGKVVDVESDGDGDKPSEEEMREAVDAGAAGAALMVSCGFGLVAFAAFGFWLWMLIDCCTKEFPGSSDKTMWILVIVLVGAIGALIYLIAGRPNAIKKNQGRGRHRQEYA